MISTKLLMTAVLALIAGTSGLRAADEASLAGPWAVRLDPKDVGAKESWFNDRLEGKIELPGTLALAGLGEATQGADAKYLTVTHKFVGPAWYQREIEIPASWKDRKVSLSLERVLWRSSVWIDGRPAGEPIDLLGVPHEHDLGILPAGKHLLTVCVDNRAIYPIGGQGHHYYAGMQTIWNGMVGRIVLRSRPAVSMPLVRHFPSFKDKTLGIEMNVRNETGAVAKRAWSAVVTEKKNGREVARMSGGITAAVGGSSFRQELRIPGAQLWDEFSPVLYTVRTTLGEGAGVEVHEADIGFRDLGTSEYHLTINGRPIFLRGNHDGCIFPLTGHPPTDVGSWLRILRIYKAHGLNCIRFHSWTPPEAAFTAADELGIYIQTEHFWCQPDLNPELEAFVKLEMRATLDRYGNHPSMCLVLCGNELGGNLERYGEWMKADKQHDPRHLYSVAAGRRVKGADDFTEYGAKMNWQMPGTDWDYRGYYVKYHLPGIPEFVHELGQPATHPNWNELAKYTGVLKPRNYEKFRELAVQAGVEKQSAAFQKASGRINVLNYKQDIEANLRTPESAGYGLLDMHDFPGQGEALVGWLDAFYDEKGFLTAEEFSRYGGATVPLARLPKFVYTEGEVFPVKAELAHYGAAPLKDAVMTWKLSDDSGGIRASGKLPPCDVPVGTVTKFGEFGTPLTAKSPRGEHLTLELAIAGKPWRNTWDLWVFPKPGADVDPAGVVIVEDPEEAVKALDRGQKVLLLANRLGLGTLGAYASFKPPFWTATYFGGGASSVSGAVIQDKHPALASFPTSDVLDWQWQTLCSDAKDYIENPQSAWRSSPIDRNADGRGFDLKGFPEDYRPIVQPVADFHFPAKIGTVFEVRTASKGRLLVCGYNLVDNLTERPVARQLRKSLLAYMASEKFAPGHEVGNDWILKTFERSDKPMPMPAGFEKAVLYVKAGGKHPTKNGGVNWSAQEDSVAPAEGAPRYKVECSTVWADAGGTAWAGAKLRVEITMTNSFAGDLKVRFHDWNKAGRSGVVRSEDDQVQQLGAHQDGQWLSFPIRLEDCLDGKIVLEAEVSSGPNLMMTDLVLMPR